MEGELKLLLRQFKHKATSTYSYLIASKLNNAILIDPVKEEIKKYQKKLKEFNRMHASFSRFEKVRWIFYFDETKFSSTKECKSMGE